MQKGNSFDVIILHAQADILYVSKQAMQVVATNCCTSW
jgi:hypothetical protein